MRTFITISFMLFSLACSEPPPLPDDRSPVFADETGKADGEDFEALPDGAYFASLTYRREADPLWRTRLLGGFAELDSLHAVSLDLYLLPGGRYVARHVELVPRGDGGWNHARERRLDGSWPLAGDGKIALAGLGAGVRDTYVAGERRAPGVTITLAKELGGVELMVVAVRSTAPYEDF